jgi:hypothetical protein
MRFFLPISTGVPFDATCVVRFEGVSLLHLLIKSKVFCVALEKEVDVSNLNNCRAKCCGFTAALRLLIVSALRFVGPKRVLLLTILYFQQMCELTIC